MADSVDPNQMLHSVAFDLGLNCCSGLSVQIPRVITGRPQRVSRMFIGLVILLGPATFFHEVIMKYFLQTFSPFGFSYFEKGSCQFLVKEFALVNGLEDYACPTSDTLLYPYPA